MNCKYALFLDCKNLWEKECSNPNMQQKPLKINCVLSGAIDYMKVE